MKVKDIMSEDVIYVEVPGSRADALSLMAKRKVTGLPVVDKKGKLVGHITRQHIFAKPMEDQLALIMDTKPLFVSPGSDVRRAAKLLVDKNSHLLSVINKSKEVVGVVTPADLLSVVEDMKIADPVERYIRSPCVPIYQETPLEAVAEIMDITNLFAFPILNRKGRLVGIITDRDLFNVSYIDEGTSLTELGLGDDEDAWSWIGLRNVMKLYHETSKMHLPPVPVKDLMIRRPVSVFKGSRICDAAREMRVHDFGQLPVLDVNNRLKAMIYDLDVIASIIPVTGR
jgi:CBS domain-containing protein